MSSNLLVQHREITKNANSGRFLWSFAGAVALIRLDAGGQIFVLDLFALFGLLRFIISARHRLLLAQHYNEVRRIFLWGALWAFGLFLSDLKAGTDTIEMLKGQLRIFLMFGLLLVLISVTDKHLNQFLLGFAFSWPCFFLLYRPTYNLWKFGLATSICWLILIYSRETTRSRFVNAITILALAGFCLYVDARSTAAQLGTVAVLLVLSGRGDRRFTFMLRTVLVLVLTSSIIYFTYQFLAANGLLGTEALDKYRMQSLYQAPLLVVGRREIVYSSTAITASPLLGYGTHPRIGFSVKERAERLEAELSLPPYTLKGVPLQIDMDPIPLHSYLFQSWVEAGISGALFWVMVMKFLFQSAWLGRKHNSPHSSLLLFFLVLMSWEVLFSPFGGQNRILVAVVLAVGTRAISAARERRVS